MNEWINDTFMAHSSWNYKTHLQRISTTQYKQCAVLYIKEDTMSRRCVTVFDADICSLTSNLKDMPDCYCICHFIWRDLSMSVGHYWLVVCCILRDTLKESEQTEPSTFSTDSVLLYSCQERHLCFSLSEFLTLSGLSLPSWWITVQKINEMLKSGFFNLWKQSRKRICCLFSE